MADRLPVAASRPLLPDVADLFKSLPESERNFLRELINSIERELVRRAPIDEAIHERLLFSPNGSVYSVTVSDTGVAVVTPKYVVA